AALDALAGAQRIDDRLGLLGRNREADADIAAGGRVDRRVDADDVAVEIEHRAARIAEIDRGIGLDIAVVRAGAGIAMDRRDDTGGHRPAEAERIADRDYPVADARRGRVAEIHEGQAGRVDLEERQVRRRVTADQLGLI